MEELKILTGEEKRELLQFLDHHNSVISTRGDRDIYEALVIRDIENLLSKKMETYVSKERINELIDRAFDRDLGTYDYDVIAEDLLTLMGKNEI